MMHEQGLDDIVAKQLGLDLPQADLSEWQAIVEAKQNPTGEVNVAMVGKYMDLKDSYISLVEALMHGGIHTRTRVNIHYIESRDIEEKGTDRLREMDGVVVPGGFGDRGIEGKIETVRYARENSIPYLGICLGLQVAVIEAARNLAGLEGAMSTEFNRKTPHPVVALITEWQTVAGDVEERDETSEMGGHNAPRGAANKPERRFARRHELRQNFDRRSVIGTVMKSTTTIVTSWKRRVCDSQGYPSTISSRCSSISGSPLVPREPVPP